MKKINWVENKIYDVNELALECNRWRLSGKKIVFTNGCFDIVHYGHLDYLVRSADLGDKLIIGVNSDVSVRGLKGDDRPINKEYDRLFQLASLLYVDAVCIFNESIPKELIELLKPDILVKGGDYDIKDIIGADFVLGNGGCVHIIPFVDGYSTTKLIEFIRG